MHVLVGVLADALLEFEDLQLLLELFDFGKLLAKVLLGIDGWLLLGLVLLVLLGRGCLLRRAVGEARFKIRGSWGKLRVDRLLKGPYPAMRRLLVVVADQGEDRRNVTGAV